MKLKKMVVMIALGMPSMIVSLHQNRASQVQVDSMVDFRYPVSVMEQVHTNLAHVLYDLEMKPVHKSHLQNDVIDTSIHTLQEVDDLLTSKQHNIKSEDIDFLESMIDRIDKLIEHLEGDDDRAASVRDMCQSIKEKLS